MLAKKNIFTSIVIIAFSALLGNSARAEQSQDARKVAERLATFVQSAVTVNGFDDMVMSLSKFNRDRIAENPLLAYERLNAAIAQLQRSYASAYGRSLTITAESLSEIRVAQIDKDRITAKHGSRPTDIRMNFEAFVGNRWRIELVNPKADLLADALTRQCTALASTQWPRDPEAGRRLVAERILAALTQPPSAMPLQQTDAK